MLEVERAVTVKMAVSKESRSFSQLVHKDGAGRDELLITLSAYIGIVFREFFGEGKTLSESQCIMFADEFISIHHLTVEDFVAFVAGCKKGAYGKLYGQISIPTLNEWLDAYLDIRDGEYDKVRKMEFQPEYNLPRVNSIGGDADHEKHISELFENPVRDTYEQFQKRNSDALNP